MKKLLNLVPRILLLLIVALSCVTVFTSCSERKMTEIVIENNSFSENYAVDTPLNLDGAFILVRYEKGESERVQITPEMVSGYDVATTGRKTLTVSYYGLSDTHSYTVYNSEDASKEVLSSARLKLYATAGENSISYTVKLEMGDLNGLSAVKFTLSSTTSLGINVAKTNLTVTSPLPSTVSYDVLLSDDGTALTMVLFEVDGNLITDAEGSLVTLKIEQGSSLNVALKNITISDGQTDYFLPATA